MLRRAGIVVLLAFLGFVTSLTIHLTAYFRYIPMEMFLLYCRVEWVLVALVAFLMGVWMPSTTPRRQLVTLFRWIVGACAVLAVYAVYCGSLYLNEAHPRKMQSQYVVHQRGAILRVISPQEYQSLARAEHRRYIMYLNRAFSIVWVILFFGIGVYGIGYLRRLRQMPTDALSPEKHVPWWYGG